MTTRKNLNTMCVIIVKHDGLKLPVSVAKKSALINPHGLGVIWMDTFEITYHKSRDYKVLESKRPFIAHFRYATVGAINKENTHPFRCGKNENEWLMMNGTIKGKGNKKESDSRVLARELGELARNKWKKELEKYECRFVTVNTRNKTYQIYNKHLWTLRDGIWYSKSNVLEEEYVAVYGTLKKGHSNYYNYLYDATFVGHGVTANKYPLIIKGLPYLIQEFGKGYNVDVDVFKVSKELLTELDRLEGHPHWYRRDRIKIKMHSGDEVFAWVYFNIKEKSNGHEFHKTYVQQVYRSKYSNSRFGLEPMPIIEDEPDDVDFLVEDECPVCINCFHDLKDDTFGNYYCEACGGWFSENEVVKFRSNAE